MKKRIFTTLLMLFVFVCALCVTVSAAEDYNATFTLGNKTTIEQYLRHYSTETSFSRAKYTDVITIEFFDENENPVTSVPMWEYDEKDGRYYSLVWYISDWEFVTEDVEVTVSGATYTRPKYISAEYTLSKVRAVDIRYDCTYSEKWSFSTSKVGYDYTYTVQKPLWGMFLTNGTEDTSDDYKLQGAIGIGRDNNDHNNIGYEAQFAATGNKIVVANLKDATFDADCDGNYGTKTTWKLAHNLQCLWYPDTFKYMCGGIGAYVTDIDLGGIEVISCQILRDQKNVKNLVLPNSLIYLPSEAFRGSDLSSLTISEGLLYNESNVYLWTGGADVVYLPKTVAENLISSIPTLLAHQKVTIYFDGDLADAEALGSRITSEDSNYSTIAYYDYNVTDTRTSSNGVAIFYNYNRCDAFYESEHDGDDFDCTTTTYCERCKATFEKLDSHNITVNTLVYANGFDKNGIRNYICDNPGCSAMDEVNKICAPIITAKGYSFREEDKTGLNGGYSIDISLFNLYETLNGNVKIGIILVNAADAKANGMVDADFNLIIKTAIKPKISKSKEQALGACSFLR